MSAINLFGGILNNLLNYHGGFIDFYGRLIFVGIFCGLYLVEGDAVKNRKDVINIGAFYVQKNMFTLADYKRLITPMAIAVTAKFKGTTLYQFHLI
jgi:hypothetical protein